MKSWKKQYAVRCFLFRNFNGLVSDGFVDGADELGRRLGSS